MTALLATRVVRADAASVADAARVLAEGGLVSFPTETVYGLGADATNGRAIARLYEAKGRPAFNPLIAHVLDQRAALALARFSADAEQLAAAFWPRPLTLVLPKVAACPVAELATAGLGTARRSRVPSHRVARDILNAFGDPVVAPSANRSSHACRRPKPNTSSGGSKRADRSHRRWRRDAGRPGIDDRCVSWTNRNCCGRAVCRGRRLSERLGDNSATRRPKRSRRRRRPARTRHVGVASTRRARGSGSISAASRPARRCSPSDPALAEDGERQQKNAQPSRRAAASRRSRYKSVLAPARPRCGWRQRPSR